MTTIRKVIGRLPMLIGEWQSNYREGQGYMKNNRVLIFNSELQSKIDNNTYVPATQNSETGVITFDTTHWIVVNDGRSTIGLDEKLAEKYVKPVGGIPATDLAFTPATLDSNGLVPAENLPSYVDDIVELLTMSSTAPATCAKGDHYFNTSTNKIVRATAANTWGTSAATNTTPEKGKIYYNLADEKSYRWSGTQMVLSGADLQIGTVTGTAADGGTVNTHINNTSNPHNVTAAQVGLGNVGNFKAVSTEASQGLSETEKTNARTNIGAGTSSFSGNYNDLNNTPNIYTQNEIDTKIGNIGNQSVKQYVDEKFLSKCINITYSALKALRDSGNLNPGQWYRITDYVTTVGSQITDARSAGHRFDLVVLATSSNTIAEEAQAVKHEYPSDYIPADTSAPDYQEKYDEVHYWDRVPMELWKIDYCLDNNTDKFEWACNADYTFINITSDPVPYNPHLIRYAAGDAEGADYPYCWGDSYFHVYTASETPAVGDTAYGASDGTGNSYTLSVVREVAGKGVIYHMVDENNNDIPYDFKNIQFKRPVNAGRSGLVLLKFDSMTDIGPATAFRYMNTLAGILGTEVTMENIAHYHSLGIDTIVLGSGLLSGDYIDWEGNDVAIDTNAEYIPYINAIKVSGNKDAYMVYAKIVNYDWFYTFDGLTLGDLSIVGNSGILENDIEAFINPTDKQLRLNNILFIIKDNTNSNRGVRYNKFEQCCYNITFAQSYYYNNFAKGSRYITAGYNMTTCQMSGLYFVFGSSCRYNIIQRNSAHIIAGNSFMSNYFDVAQYCSFGDSFRENIFGHNTLYLAFGSNCRANSGGNTVQYVFMGDNIQGCVFDDYTFNILYGNNFRDVQSNLFHCTFKGNQYLRLVCDVPTGSDTSKVARNIIFDEGLQGNSSSDRLELHIDEAGQDYSIFYKNEDQRVIPVRNTTVGEIVIDQSGAVSDPDGMVSVRNIQYFENIRSMCRLVSWDGTIGDGGVPVLKEVSREDKGLYADGTTRDVTEDLFVEIPRLWYKGVETGGENSDIWTVYIKMDKDHDAEDTTYHLFEKRLVGVYKGYVANNKLRSLATVTPTTDVSQADFKTYARNLGDGFSLVDYDTHKLLALLFYGLYNTTDCQSKCGSGGNHTHKITGYSDTFGMTDTNAITGNGPASTGFTNFLGVENWWGDTVELLDDLVTADAEGTVNILDKSDGTTVRSVSCAVSNTVNCIIKMVMGEYVDLLPAAYSGDTDYTVNYTDAGSIYDSDNNVGNRSGNGNFASCGVNDIQCKFSNTYTNAGLGSRLIYTYPTPAPAGE